MSTRRLIAPLRIFYVRQRCAPFRWLVCIYRVACALPQTKMAQAAVVNKSIVRIALGDHGKTVRITPVLDGEARMSLREVIECICNVTKEYASNILDRLRNGENGNWEEILTCCKTFQFPGRGERKMPCISVMGVNKLIMFLPSTAVVRCCRTKLAETLARHLKGDPTLAAETANNARIGVAAACANMLSEAASEAAAEGAPQVADVDVEQRIAGVKRLRTEIEQMDVAKLTAVYGLEQRREEVAIPPTAYCIVFASKCMA